MHGCISGISFPFCWFIHLFLCRLWQYHCCCSVAQLCLTLWYLMDCRTPGFLVLHCLLALAETHVHWISDAIQLSHPLSSPSSPAFSLSQHQDLFQRFGSSSPVVTYRCVSWTIKKAERQRIDAFQLCWRTLLRVPWTPRRSNQWILKEINPEYSLEGLMLKLKLQSFD